MVIRLNGERKGTELKNQHFDGYKYRGCSIHTKLVIVGKGKYKCKRILNPSDVYETFKKLRESDREKLYAILLDDNNCVIGVELISKGSISSAHVHPGDVFKSVILTSASGLILVHSHPCGNPLPSPEDRHVTIRLEKAGALLGIPVLDHIIIGQDCYFSFSFEVDSINSKENSPGMESENYISSVKGIYSRNLKPGIFGGD